MKTILLSVLSAVFFGFISNAQSDGCTSATVIGVTADCTSPISGTTTGATETIAGCTGNADDDVWYQFVATSVAHQIIVMPSVGMDPVVQLFSGGCGTLISLSCKDGGLTGATETINYNGLTPGNTYRIRIYDYYAGSGSGDFSLCVTTPPPAPSNNICSSPTALSVSSSCSFVSATTDGASESFPGCSGNADDDVWFSFIATNSLQNILVSPTDNLDLVFQVYSGSCASLTSIACIDNTLTAQDEQSDIVGLIPGATYLVRVYDYFGGTTGDFQICVTGTPTPAPTNDEPCDAIQLPNVTATCLFSQFTTVGATDSQGPPIPSTCSGGSGAAIGGFSASSADVWFAITVPASGNVDVTSQPLGGAGNITDGVMALYSGSCSALTQITCSDDHNYPGSTFDFMPLLSASGLTPGSTVYLRYWGFGSSQGDFGICVSTATNDDCLNALYICDINGYSASTSASYTIDRPSNMRGNAEVLGTYAYTPGTNQGGIFGINGNEPAYDVQIDNNSWIKFTAALATATLTVDISDCFTNQGIQMQVFEADNCTNFVPVSNFSEGNTNFTLVATGLTIGNDYYLMVDGFAGDICNYTITAESGVQFPEIVPVAPLCIGGTVTLDAPPGASSYNWIHSGETTQSVTVTPATTQTYTCEVTGLCDYKQTLNTTVVVNPLPNVSITNGASTAICAGDNVDLIATGASTYTWSTTETGATINVSPGTLTNYTVTGIDVNGCSNSDVIAVNVNSLPTLAVTPTSTDSDCGGSNGSLIGAAAGGNPNFTYSWSDGISTIGSVANLSGIPAGNYYLTVTDGNTCSDLFGPFNISNPGAPAAPSISFDDDTPCFGSDIQLTVTGVGGATFDWSGPNGFSSTNNVVNLSNMTNLEEGTYCVSQTVAGCTGPSACQLITIDQLPIVNIVAANNDSTICLNEDIIMNASGAATYSWTGPDAFTGSNSTETINNATSINAGTYVVTGTDLNGCDNTAEIIIDILPLPTLVLTSDVANSTYCIGGNSTLTASGADTYVWSGPNNYTSTDNPTTVLDLTADYQGYYSVEATDIEGCVNSDSLMVNIVTNVPAQSPSDTSLCPGSKIILYGNGGDTYFWTGPSGFSSQEQNPAISSHLTSNQEGWYVLTVLDANGCAGFDSTYIDVSNGADCLVIPNLITPNLDGDNDNWVIEGLETIDEAEVSIFNRWGNLIYYSSPYFNDWNGEVNKGTSVDGADGKVPPGTYFYIINLNNGDETGIFKGYLEVEY